jgi:pimeloyl-ACP methyl ester carboxylesterase
VRISKPIVGSNLPTLDWATVTRHEAQFRLPYCLRKGTTGPALIFIHGLGGAKENFYAAFQSAALAHCHLLAMDFPGTGLAEFDQTSCPDVSTLADLTRLVWEKVLPGPAFVVGASMGGLTALLLFRRYGHANLQGFINIEGNLTSEDCMFSRKAASVGLDELASTLYPRMATALLASKHPGDHMAAHNMALNTDIRAYHTYSFETVAESDSSRLLQEFLNLPVPRLFLYGEANKSLSYLPLLRASSVEVCEIPASAHFLFYDNPIMTYEAIGKFVDKHHRGVR